MAATPTPPYSHQALNQRWGAGYVQGSRLVLEKWFHANWKKKPYDILWAQNLLYGIMERVVEIENVMNTNDDRV